MSTDDPLLPDQKRVPLVTSETQSSRLVTGTVATRDHVLIRHWASQRHAEPATGEATKSGAAAPMTVRDEGAGIRFNFPGAARFRVISWEEWLEHFDQHELTFVYEETAPASSPPSGRYRIVNAADWSGVIGE